MFGTEGRNIILTSLNNYFKIHFYKSLYTIFITGLIVNNKILLSTQECRAKTLNISLPPAYIELKFIRIIKEHKCKFNNVVQCSAKFLCSRYT